MSSSSDDKAYLLLKSIQDNAAHALIATTKEGIITSFNPMAEKMLGYSAVELVGKQSPAVFHDLEEVIKRAKEFSEKLGTNIEPGFETFICHTNLFLKNEFEWTYVHKDGTKFPVLLSITAIRDQNNEIQGYLGIAQDLTEQKILEKELKFKNRELETAQSLAKIGSWHFDIESGKITWSKEMFNIFPEDIEKGEPEFDRHRSTIHPDDFDHWESVVSKCITDGKAYKMLFRTFEKHDSSKEVWVEARGRGSIRDGQVIALSGTCQDVTDLVTKEFELKNNIEALRLAERAKSEFLANMSHEIRTPLNGIMGMIDLLKDSGVNSNQREMLDVVSGSSQVLLKVISDILDLSKIEADKLELESISFSLKECLEDLYNLMKSNIDPSKVKFNLNIPENCYITVKGDLVRIKQILTNFLSNAIKFTSSGEIILGLEKLSNTNFRFFVKDTGIGVREADKERLFKPFEQADTSIVRRYGGTGLGLTISSKLASRLGGKIDYESESGVGSTFSLTIDLEEGKAKKKELTVSLSDQFLADDFPHRILAVEDNPINQKVVKMTLKKLGYNCEIANNGIEALEKLKMNSSYTFILMDMQMPEMDGLTATKEIRKIENLKGSKIVALTANAFFSDKQHCLEAGMDGYLSKPLKKSELIQYLKDFCPKRSSHKSA